MTLSEPGQGSRVQGEGPRPLTLQKGSQKVKGPGSRADPHPAPLTHKVRRPRVSDHLDSDPDPLLTISVNLLKRVLLTLTMWTIGLVKGPNVCTICSGTEIGVAEATQHTRGKWPCTSLPYPMRRWKRQWPTCRESDLATGTVWRRRLPKIFWHCRWMRLWSYPRKRLRRSATSKRPVVS